jgi:hypothetical protein
MNSLECPPAPPTVATLTLFDLQLAVARRADELGRDRPSSRAGDLVVWQAAEAEILSFAGMAQNAPTPVEAVVGALTDGHL